MMKSKRMQLMHSLLAGLLTLALVIVPVLSSLPAIQAEAAEQQWYHVMAGSGNGNGHAYSNASSNPAAVLLNKSPMADGGELSLTYQKMGTISHARLGFFYTYVDDDNWLYVGCNPGGSWYYEYKVDGSTNYPSLDNLQSQSDDSAVKFSMSVEGSSLTVKVNNTTQTVENAVIGTLMTKAAGNGKYGFRAGKFVSNGTTEVTEFHFADVKLNDTPVSGDWEFLADCEGQVFESEKTVVYHQVTGKVVDKDGTAIEGASAQIGDTTVTSGADGTFLIPAVTEGDHEISVSCKGYKAVRQAISVDADKDLGDITLLQRQDVTYDHYIESDDIKAAVSTTFPQVMQYVMKTGSETGSIFFGQEEALNTMKINGVEIVPELVGEAVLEKDNISYVMNLKNEASQIDMQMKIKISVKENDLTWQVTEITKNEGCTKINSIEVPNLNLITIMEEQADTQFMGTNNSGHVDVCLDEELHFGSDFKANDSKLYSYGFLSAEGLSAGVWSNSEATVKYNVVAGDNGTDGDSRLVRNNGADSISVTSNLWYYEYGNMPEAAKYDNVPVSELPCAKVCLTADLNEDGVANWQDGAIAYRDIMNNPQGAEDVPELVNYRIAMNFASQAAHPFLNTADNIMKVYLATDGLEQAVMLKGFGNEGHDSANSEYGDIGERIGGAEDMKKLIELAHKYNTEIGIHVNAHEIYPEALSFDDQISSTGYGWGWLDQSYGINREYDLGTGLRYKRFLQLFDQLNDTSLYGTKWPNRVGSGSESQETLPGKETISNTVQQSVNTGTNLDFIYLDVWWGAAWETRKVAEQINSLGWRFSTEFGVSGEYDSTWQHWASDRNYGGRDGKGHNSEVRRFIKNHQTDSFVLNAPDIGGAADNPLLGGLDIEGFEGWQNNNNFDRYINNTFGINVPSKFLQHYQVVKWEDYPVVNGVSTSPVANHEKEITLKDGDDVVVVTRNEEQREDNFVERTITLNGKVVLDDVTYLIPWTERATGEEKLYHWNYDGGETTWDLQDGWSDLENVKVYPLSDQGRGKELVVPVISGKITLNAEAQTAYVLVKGTEATKKKTVNYGEKNYVTDPGFNSYAGTGEGSSLNSDVWSGDISDSSVKVVRRTSGNQNLVIDSPSKDVAVSTTITGLEKGKDYVAEIYVDNKSKEKATIEVTGGKETVSNYTLKSLAGNYIRCDAHNENAVSGSRMQIMQVSFVAASDKATLSLKRKAGDGITYFDDIRIVPKKLDNYKADGSFEQDFETVVQGLYPFVLGPAQGVDDPGTHLSQLHEPYTQCGFRGKLMDDVIDGNWSLKQHDTYFRKGIIYRTIPQNFHFEPNTTYEVSFDYQTGANDTFAVVLGIGEDTTKQMEYLETTAAAKAGEACTTGKVEFILTGDESGQSWFGLYSNTSKDKGENVLGDFDLVLDNLVIKEAPVSLAEANITVTEANKPQKAALKLQDGVETDSVTWISSDESVVTIDNKGNMVFHDFGKAVVTATVVIDGKTYVLDCGITVPKSEIIEQEQKFDRVYTNTEQTTSEPAPSGFAAAIIDGDVSSYWHSQWSGAGFKVSESNPAIVTIKLADDAESFGGFRFLQRTHGEGNGLIKKFSYVVGDEFNEATNELKGTVYGPVTLQTPTGGTWVSVELPETTNSKYVQIRVLSGGNDFACMNEFETFGTVIYENNKIINLRKELKASADEAKEVEIGDYTDKSWNAFQDAIEKADAASFDGDSDTISKAADALKKAKDGLVVDEELVTLKEQLETKVNEAKAVENADYTDESWDAFQSALEAAKAVQGQRDKEALASAIDKLQKAKDGLTVDEELVTLKEQLQSKVNEAKAVQNDNYTDESWNAFQSALEAAEAVQGQRDKEVLANAIDNLKKAKDGLTKKTDEELIALQKQLQTKIEEAKAVKNDNYTDQSWNAFQTALKAAEAAKGQSDKAVITNAINALQKAKDGLTKKSGTTPPPVVKVKLATPKISSVKSAANGVTVKWKAVPGAASYEIRRNGKIVDTVKKTTFLDKTPKANAVNTYTVVAKGDASKYTDSGAAKKATKKLPAKGTVSKAKKAAKKQAKITWKKVKGATGYAVLRSTKKNGTYKKIKEVKKVTSYVDKKAPGKTYYYKIVVKKGKLYGPASSPKKMK